MDVEYHAGGIELHFCIWLGGKVVEKLRHLLFGHLCHLGLITCNSAQCWQYNDVYIVGVVKNVANDLLNSSESFLV